MWLVEMKNAARSQLTRQHCSVNLCELFVTDFVGLISETYYETGPAKTMSADTGEMAQWDILRRISVRELDKAT